MEKNKKKKQVHSIFMIFFLLALYVGYCIGSIFGEGYEIRLDTVLIDIKQAFLSPLPFKITQMTGKCILGSLAVWLLAYLYCLGNIKNYMPEKEFGTARFATPGELNKKLEDKKKISANKILSEHLRVSLDFQMTGLNNNAVFIGGPGSGKSFRAVRPNLYQCNSSFVVTDPKGELLRDTGNFLKMHGYRIRVLNLVDMLLSDCYNPFVYIRSENDIIKLITNLIANTTPKGSRYSDPFWEKAEAMYLQSIFLYVWYEFPKQGKTANFRGVLELLNKAEHAETGQSGERGRQQSELDKLMGELTSQHPALIAYKKVMSGAGDTIRSIIISANSRLAYLQNPDILRILDQDEIQNPFLGEGVYENPERKMALFCVIPDNDKSYNFMVGLLYTQIFQELYRIADHKYVQNMGKLPVHVAFWMDEFANVALPDGFLEILSTCRSRNIGINIIIQNLAQLKTLFKDAWETIIGDCDAFIYLGGNEQSTHKFVSEMLDRMTIDKQSTGETKGSHGSSSHNYDVLGRELMRPGEVRKLENEKCLVLLRGFDAVADSKYRTWEKAEFKEAENLGIYVDRHELEELQRAGHQQFFFGLSGEDGKRKSYYFMIEEYGGIFEESTLYEDLDLTEKFEKKVGVLPEQFGSYFFEDKEVWPVFSEAGETIRSGGEILIKHPIIGYCTEAETVFAEKNILQTIFRKENRIMPFAKDFSAF